MSGAEEKRPEEVVSGQEAEQQRPAEEATSEGVSADDAARAVEEELEKLRRERDEFLQLLQRVRAEYENHRKRMERLLEEERRYAIAPFARELLGVLDNFERAIEAAEQSKDVRGILEGVKMIYNEMLRIMERYGIRPIESDGQTFDPAYHEAMAQEQREDVPEGRVIRTLQRGYTLHDRLLRPAKVVVSAATQQPAPARQEEGPTDNRPTEGES